MTPDRLTYLREFLVEKLTKIPDFHDTFLTDDNDRIFWICEDGEVVVITLSPGRIVEVES